MRRCCLIVIIVIAVGTTARAQSYTAEVMAGDKNYWHQYTASLAFRESRFGLFATSSLHLMYPDREKNEVMSQFYATYSVSKGIAIAAGTFYATKPGISPSLAVQFRFSHDYLSAVVVPRVDVKNGGAVELMTLVEFVPPVTERLFFYSRIQAMSNYGPGHHNRSYQNIRLGLRTGYTSFGFALNVDERGPEKETMHNWGAFLRYSI